MRTLDLLECAEFLKIERTHTLKLCGEGTIPGAKIGKNWVFLEDDLVEYLRKQVRLQMRERSASAEVQLGLDAAVARSKAMTPVRSPLAAVRNAAKRPRLDLSGYNDDGSPKLCS
ncbi:MAG: helix-turn-helix domain-containing protein [Telluria sp.]